MRFYFVIISLLCVFFFGCANHHAMQKKVEYAKGQSIIVDFYIDKTTESEIVNALGTPVERVEYFDDDEWWDLGYPNCYESGADTVKHVKLTYNGMYITKKEINKNHIKLLDHKIIVNFHHLNGQIVTQTYDKQFSLIIHNGKLREIPDGSDGRTGICIPIVDHR